MLASTEAKTDNKDLLDWVESIAKHARPSSVEWFDGSEGAHRKLIAGMLKDGVLLELNQKEFPGCYLHRSHPSDVARTEKSTFICTPTKEEAGPLNNWMPIREGKAVYEKLFRGCMGSRTMYVVPYLMGPPGPYSQAGVEITDSPYVAASLKIMTRAGEMALKRMGKDFVRGIHSMGALKPEEKYILHFPEERLVMSINSNYGGNALLNKKCHALRIASVQANKEGWMAEHMLLLEVERPDGKKFYVAGAFPSASGKTNLAMLKPPKAYEGWKCRLIGDDIAWLHPGKDGLRAINPEYGFFGVAPGTSEKTNPNAMAAIRKNTIFTNVALTKDGKPWWEGLPEENEVIDWNGNRCDPKEKKAAHPNSRFTAPLSQYPHLSSRWEDPEGVPLSAILFGGRRESLVPLVYQSFDWKHGVFVGAGMGVEQTAAAEGRVGEVRRDPMAMRPFCGYGMADYFAHWLGFENDSANLPKIFYVNWFRKKGGKFLWPGYGENIRVLEWIIERCEGKGNVEKKEIGYLPTGDAINAKGLGLKEEAMEELLRVDKAGWLREANDVGEFLKIFGERLPKELWEEHSRLIKRLHDN